MRFNDTTPSARPRGGADGMGKCFMALEWARRIHEQHRRETQRTRRLKERLRQQKIADEIAWRMHARLDREMDERIASDPDRNNPQPA